MPILTREPDTFPDGLLEAPEAARVGEAQWWAMYCRPRQEKQLMRRLHQREVPFCAPLVAHRSRPQGGRMRVSYVPLFTGYVFVYGDNSDRYAAMTTGCVSRWLPVPDGPALVHDLLQVRRLIETGAPLTVESRLEAGDRVRIRSGPFLGIEGTILRRHGQMRLLVTVDFLQQGASVLLDQCEVEPQ